MKDRQAMKFGFPAAQASGHSAVAAAQLVRAARRRCPIGTSLAVVARRRDKATVNTAVIVLNTANRLTRTTAEETDEPQIEISFVVPVFNEQRCSTSLSARLDQTMEPAHVTAKWCWSMMAVRTAPAEMVDAGLPTGCAFQRRAAVAKFWPSARRQRRTGSRSRQHRGHLDGDLQDPPELLLDFYRRLQEGYDVVYAVRKNRKEGRSSEFCYWAFYRLLVAGDDPDSARRR